MIIGMPDRIGDGAALLPGSFAMPGSVIEDEAVLMEHTQACCFQPALSLDLAC